jgi:hypothetical protein
MVLPTSGSISISDINSCARFTNGNMGINTTSPNFNLDINGTLKATTITTGTILATTSISSGAVNATNSTVTNIVATNSTVTNLRSTVSTIGTLRSDLGVMSEAIIVKASISTSLTAANLLATTGISSGAVNATNSTVTNIVATSLSSGTLNLSTGVTAATILATNANLTTETVGTSRITSNLLALGNSNTVGNIFTTGGNVGIGTTSPTSRLHIANPTTLNTNNVVFEVGTTADGNNSGWSALNFNGYHNAGETRINTSKNRWRLAVDQRSTIDSLMFDTYNGTTLTNIMTMNSVGNVGIGTTSPSEKLNVSGNADMFGTLRVGASSSSGSYLINLGTIGVAGYRSGYLYGDGTNMYLANQQNGSINFTTNNTSDRLVIGASGNIGIGTISPNTLLHLYKSTNGGVVTYIQNPSNGSSAYVGYQLETDAGSGGVFSIFKNSTTRTFDGGANTTTMRNDGGALRLQSNTGSGMLIDTSGNVTVYGALSKGSGTFDIQHPLHPDDSTKRLVHSFIEGPRCDLIYRGKVQLVNGTATINIDSDCVEETGSGMTQGTFEALCANPQFFLQNPSSFSRLKGSISGNILSVVCEDQNSSDIIYWSVIAERKDNFIKQWGRTNVNGYLITEYEKVDIYNP